MPRRAERHARTGEPWDSQPSRSADLAAVLASDPDPSRRPPGRKDTKSWCRGKPGVEHIPKLVFRPPSFRRDVTVTCRWASGWFDDGVRWDCHHQAECSRCGKILVQRVAPEACPAWPGDEAQKAAAIEQARAGREEWELRQAARRTVISGPQHYRKKKAS